MSERETIMDLIRNEYDPAPSHYRMGDNWDDGAGRIADAILADETIRMRAALSAKWQPIETAPRNGTFLVYLPDEYLKKFHVMYRKGNISIIGGTFSFDMTKPTHWMPLPEPPEEAK